MEEQVKRPHHGQNIKRLREILKIKQEVIGNALDVSQQTISQLEKKETIDQETLGKLAKAMNVPQEAIENLTDEFAVNVFSNTFNSHDNSTAIASAYNSNLNFNPIEKIVELYERLLALEKEKSDLLRQLHDKK